MATPTAADPGAVQPPTRATAPQTPRVAGLESLLQPIRQQILQAVKVLFDRSITPPGNPDDPRIVDNKPSLPNTGTVQDCEFGMILLLVRNWIGEHFFQLTSINPAAFEQVTLSLVARTIKRVIERQTDDEGGGGSCRVFFNGSPYTKYGQDMYSANLDAAMLILAFLAMALEDYSDQLANADHGISADLPENAQPAQWVRTLRDAALYVILEGLNYALDCRVTAPGKGFIGFTCDPENRAANSRDEDFLSDFDRLFFTWTACETIHDLVAWRDSYFRPVAADALPPDVVRDMSSKLGELQKTVGEAAAWSQQFLARFQVLRIDGEKFSQIVDRIEPYGKRQISDEQDKQDLKEMTEIVRYVYYIPQYAAIRSLGPQNTITLDEAELVAAKLNDLVLYGIIGSDLDAAKQRNLYDSLTRKYWLGRGEGVAKQEYADDAWYPLVVRSLSGLLSRTLDDIGQRFTRSEVINLINSYDRILQIQYNNLIKRRPGADEVHKQPELMKLWSYVDKGPYVLYSTQRTIFALIEYSK
ncbi:MAG: hypothetical protein JO097_04240, partial [Acidobacteriaceae bacterium]|nr:hypothetical protein [Acidobacteriaceae bacterium]